MREIDGMMVSGHYCRLFPIVSGYSIPLDWLRNLRLIKIVDSPAQLTVTRWKLISSHPTSHSLHRSRILQGCRPESDEHGATIFSVSWSRKSFSGICFEAQAVISLDSRNYIPCIRSQCSGSNSSGSSSSSSEYRDERIGLATRTERVRGTMFISWAVTSYQSNGAKCDFSQGISVCLIEIPYPICPACRRFAFAARLSAQFSRYSLFPLTVLHSFDLLSLFLPFFLSLFLSFHFVITSLVLLRAALFRLILSSFISLFSLSF